MTFTLNTYRHLLEEAKSAGFKLLGMADAMAAKSPVCLLRHDIDFCLEYAVEMSELEHELAAKSTYFIIPENPYYDPFSKQGSALVQRLLELGHEVGLHYDSSLYPVDAAGYRQAFKKDRDRLSQLIGRPIVSAAQHKPTENAFVDITDLVAFETYSAPVRARFDYVSDSSMAWRERTPDQLIAAGRDFQFLTHPIWWAAEGESRDEKLQSLRQFSVADDLIQLEIENVNQVLAEREKYDEAFKEKRGAPSLSLVIPAYNEEAHLVETVELALTVLRAEVEDFEVIILDDKSRDRTPEIIDELAAKYPTEIVGLKHAVNQGIAKTFEDLFQAAGKDYVFLIPGDGEYSPEIIRRLKPLIPQYDMVLCEREVRSNWRRGMISRVYSLLTRVLFGVAIRSPGSVKCIKKEIIEQIPAYSTGVFKEVERVIRAHRTGYSSTTIKVDMIEREGSGARWGLVIETMCDMVKLRGRLMIGK